MSDQINPRGLPGWYKMPACAPGSIADRKARQETGWPVVVLRLRFSGVFLPWNLLCERPRVQGKILTMAQYNAAPHAELVNEDGKVLSRSLLDVRVRSRRDDGSMILEGAEWDEGYFRLWPQTWLCCVTGDELERALIHMQEWLSKEYERARAQFQARR